MYQAQVGPLNATYITSVGCVLFWKNAGTNTGQVAYLGLWLGCPHCGYPKKKCQKLNLTHRL